MLIQHFKNTKCRIKFITSFSHVVSKPCVVLEGFCNHSVDQKLTWSQPSCKGKDCAVITPLCCEDIQQNGCILSQSKYRTGKMAFLNRWLLKDQICSATTTVLLCSKSSKEPTYPNITTYLITAQHLKKKQVSRYYSCRPDSSEKTQNQHHSSWVPVSPLRFCVFSKMWNIRIRLSALS